MNTPTKVNPVTSLPFTYGDYKAGKANPTLPVLNEASQILADGDTIRLLGDDFLAKIELILSN